MCKPPDDSGSWLACGRSCVEISAHRRSALAMMKAALLVAAALLPCSAGSEAIEETGDVRGRTLLELEEHDDDGYNALHRAATAGDAAIVGQLLEAGVDPSIRSKDEQFSIKDGTTALALAANRGHLDVVSLLLSWNADVNLSGPLVLAASNGHTDVLSLLLDAGAEINLQSGEMNGATALGAACMMGQADAVELLIEAGADVSIKDVRRCCSKAQSPCLPREHTAPCAMARR
eukprot:2620896-Prymnesium_polylepis.1